VLKKLNNEVTKIIMDLSNIKPAKGSTSTNKRLGRGQGSGWGGTAGRGHKGAKSRSGYSKKIGFEGGQMPLQRVVPKSGFKNRNRIEYKAINIEVLQQLAESNTLTEIDIKTLIDAGFISRKDKVKILGDGKLTARLTVKAHAFSKSAKDAIEQSEGTIEIL
jgi:large subunit ribosomal protein L15